MPTTVSPTHTPVHTHDDCSGLKLPTTSPTSHVRTNPAAPLRAPGWVRPTSRKLAPLTLLIPATRSPALLQDRLVMAMNKGRVRILWLMRSVLSFQYFLCSSSFHSSLSICFSGYFSLSWLLSQRRGTRRCKGKREREEGMGVISLSSPIHVLPLPLSHSRLSPSTRFSPV